MDSKNVRNARKRLFLAQLVLSPLIGQFKRKAGSHTLYLGTESLLLLLLWRLDWLALCREGSACSIFLFLLMRLKYTPGTFYCNPTSSSDGVFRFLFRCDTLPCNRQYLMTATFNVIWPSALHVPALGTCSGKRLYDVLKCVRLHRYK